jgi:hypothetical protein
MVKVGSKLVPWAGESVVAEVASVSGGMVVCRVIGGAKNEVREFLVSLQDVLEGRVTVIPSLTPHHNALQCAGRGTALLRAG